MLRSQLLLRTSQRSISERSEASIASRSCSASMTNSVSTSCVWCVMQASKRARARGRRDASPWGGWLGPRRVVVLTNTRCVVSVSTTHHHHHLVSRAERARPWLSMVWFGVGVERLQASWRRRGVLSHPPSIIQHPSHPEDERSRISRHASLASVVAHNERPLRERVFRGGGGAARERRRVVVGFRESLLLLRARLHYITLHYITLHYITLHCITLH